MTAGPVTILREPPASELRFGRPPLDILDIPTLKAFDRGLKSLARDKSVRVVVIRGTADGLFSAGADVKDHVPGKVREMLKAFHSVLRTLYRMDAVTIAAVRGRCLGGGVELALGCDFIVASENATFAFPEIDVGCYPPAALAMLPARIGRARAFRLAALGETLSAAEAERIGLVGRVVPGAGFERAVRDAASAFAAKSGAVVAGLKRALRSAEGVPYPRSLGRTEAIYLKELIKCRDAREGVRAFMEKRNPSWSNR